MKRVYIILAASGLLFFSCKTTRTITVSGIPGSNIYKPNMEKVATIQQSGSVDINLNKKEFLPYMIANAPGSSEFIHFALDYKFKNYRTGAATFMGTYLYTLGGISILVGALTSGDEESLVGPIMVGGGAGLMLLGTPFLLSENITGVQGKYQFKYLPEQNTNNDIKFTKYIDKGINKEINASSIEMPINPAEKKRPNTNNALSAALAKFKNSSTGNATYGQLVTGTYIGTGKFLQNGKQIGLLENMKILIDSVADELVSVIVQDSNGTPCFGTTNIYDVKKSGDNSYTMSLIGNSDAVIHIDSNGNMEYMHPKIEVEGEMGIFTLEIKASKK